MVEIVGSQSQMADAITAVSEICDIKICETMKRRRSDSCQKESLDEHRVTISRHRYVPETSTSSNKRYKQTDRRNENNFSFENYKPALNKMFNKISETTAIIQDVGDFWKFVTKFENLLKKAQKPIIQLKKPEIDSNTNELGISTTFEKVQCINLQIIIKELYSKVSCFDREENKKYRLTEHIFEEFLNVIAIYLDFKNKEKFTKLTKLRKAQANLPVASFRGDIVSAVQSEQVVIVAGDTGCGKSTQVPQYLAEAGFNSIACTQPRRIACISLAKRVAYESLSQFGSEVGYQIRFEKSKTQGTKICFITEGLLLRQVSSESLLSSYDVIILDEIHERHLHGDFLLGVLKCLIHSRKDMKLVLMSATINIQLFADYFTSEEAVIIKVPGRLHPIDLHYRPIFVEGKQSKSERLDAQPYLQIMQLIDNKYPSEEKGDMLIFLSGLQEITAVCDTAKQYADKTNKWVVLPLHSSLSIAEQDKVFDYPPEGVRKCIVSTNIAETSVTIDGIRFVVDSGKVKEMSYDPSCKMQRLKEFWISKASAEQRKGRAGRTGPGVCFRIYSEKEYSILEEFSSPEVSRVPLASVFLQMCSLGMSDVRRFPFLDAPPAESVENALLELKQHGALTSNERLTALGVALSRLPVEVSLAKALVLGAVLLPPHKGDASLALAAVLGVQSPYTSRAHRDIECETARKPDESDHGDPLTLLSLYCAWLRVKAGGAGEGRARGGANSRDWCKRRGLEEQRFYEVTKLAAQFRGLLQDAELLAPMENETMSSAERALRHGQMKQLKDMRRQHKQQSAEDKNKRKKLKLATWEVETEGSNDRDNAGIDIRDVEFRMMNDASRMQALISGSSTSSGRDLMTLKLVLCRAIYPQIAVADEFNHCKSVSEQLFHTCSKAFVSLHPMGFYGTRPQVLQLEDADVVDTPLAYKTRLPLSHKHQLLCYLSLLETTKPYLMNTMRMPAAQTLLLLSHGIDTNAGFTRMVCDGWLLLEFPYPDSGANLLCKAAELRERWDQLIDERLQVSQGQSSVEDLVQGSKKTSKSSQQVQFELSCDLSDFMNTSVCYTIKRLLPADLKLIYCGSEEDPVHANIDPNPFKEKFQTVSHEKKGGVYVTDHIVYDCVADTDWSYRNYQELCSTPWTCSRCSLSLCLSPLEKLQHQRYTCSSSSRNNRKEDPDSSSASNQGRPNTKQWECQICNKILYLTPVDILKHRKICK